MNTKDVNIVSEGYIGTNHLRRLSTTATTYARATNGASFVAVGGIREFFITCFNPAATPSTTEDRVLMVVDAPSESVASAWLSDLGGQDVEVQQLPIQIGVRQGPYRLFSNTGESITINWLDFSVMDANTLIFIEGVN